MKNTFCCSSAVNISDSLSAQWWVCSPKITGNLYLLIGQTTRQNSNSLPPQNVYKAIDSLQPIPRESNDKDVAAMLDELTIGADEESFVIVLHDVTRKLTCRRQHLFCIETNPKIVGTSSSVEGSTLKATVVRKTWIKARNVRVYARGSLCNWWKFYFGSL